MRGTSSVDWRRNVLDQNLGFVRAPGAFRLPNIGCASWLIIEDIVCSVDLIHAVPLKTFSADVSVIENTLDLSIGRSFWVQLSNPDIVRTKHDVHGIVIIDQDAIIVHANSLPRHCAAIRPGTFGTCCSKNPSNPKVSAANPVPESIALSVTQRRCPGTAAIFVPFAGAIGRQVIVVTKCQARNGMTDHVPIYQIIGL
uniref:Uncharacterized protein n=1 Tax=Bionectria ochroleuca TaxID=29856 RepID=A0A0B7KB03_BIOOC